MIYIVDYGAGNLGSIENMFLKLGHQALITSNFKDIQNAKKIVLPGVGNFDYGISKLKESGLIDILNFKVLEDKIPILGICLGAQMMAKSSEEGIHSGLGWFDAEVKKFSFMENQMQMRVPHMGWNYVSAQKVSPLTINLPPQPKFYFVHSYFLKANNPEDILFTSNYGGEFVAAMNKENIYALQFHPEKSHKFGLKIFQNFIAL